MPRDLSAAFAQQFDMLVIGGGSNGTAVARDAALRGLKVALLEKEDFGYGTVSRSTRLIHGGLRYLELFDFGLVREGLREREILLRTAPHLVHPLAFFTPVYKNSRVGVPKLRVGMWLYDLLSWDKSLPRHRFLNREEAAAAEPLLTTEGLRGAFVYYDGHVPMPERLCLEAALQAAAHGAVIVNHARAEKLQRTGDLYLVTARDELTARTYEVRAKSVINATGPWADEVNDRLVGAAQPELRRTKGIHLLVPKLSRHAVVMLAESDGRLFFAIPWGDYTYIGTTDTDFSGDLDRVRAEREEFEYLIRETKRVFPGADVGRVHFSTAGVRPLVRDPRARHEGQVSRKHRVKHHEDEGYPGYFSVLGGKITNMRAVAEDTVDAVVRWLGAQVKPCTTREALFPGGMHPDMDRFKEELAGRYGAHGFARETVNNLVDLYGTVASEVLDLAVQEPELARPVREGEPDIWAQLAFSVRREWTYTTADFLLRRSSMGLRPGMALRVAPEVARRLGRYLQRTDEEVAADLAAYEQAVALMPGTPD